MRKQKVSATRDNLGKVTLATLGCVWLGVFSPESQPLTLEGKEQMAEIFHQLDQMVPIAGQALMMMDRQTFIHAPESLRTPEQIKEVLEEMPQEYRHMLSEDRIKTLPLNYMLEKGTVAIAQGGFTPWQSDNVVVVSWNTDDQNIEIQSGESFMEALSHEYFHFFYGSHNFFFQRELTEMRTVSDQDQISVELSKKYGDVPYMIGDIFWMLDEWSHGQTDEFGKPLHLEMAREYGLDETEVASLSIQAIEIRREWKHPREQQEVFFTDQAQETSLRQIPLR